jgi:transcriptional regulator with XRE-family HTH domain
MSNVNNHLGHKLRALRGDKTIYQVSKEVQIDRTQLKRYETGRIPADDVLEKIALFYDVSFDELKMLSYDDLFPEGSRQRHLLFKWVQAHINK